MWDVKDALPEQVAHHLTPTQIKAKLQTELDHLSVW